MENSGSSPGVKLLPSSEVSGAGSFCGAYVAGGSACGTFGSLVSMLSSVKSAWSCEGGSAEKLVSSLCCEALPLL